MDKLFTKAFSFVIVLLVVTAARLSAQTINLQAIDPGPYGPGSTIAAPFFLNNSANCASSTNVFNLYLSDAAGNFGSPTLIGSYSGFYATFVNGIIPAGTPAGANYKLRIACTDPAISPVTSNSFVIGSGAGVAAGVSSQAINPANPEIFGACIGTDNTPYPFVNTSSGGATAVASFYNELAKTYEGIAIPVTGANFVAKAANYTVLVRAISAGVVGTKAYSLINNPVNNSFGASGSNQVCLNGKNKLTYSVDITSANGIQKNYPGLIYNVTWGDGTSTNFTLCDIVNAGGVITHTYTKSSCGNVANGQANVFKIDLQPTSPICGKLGTPVTGYAQVVSPPSNKISGPTNICTGSLVSFSNASIPGQDPDATSFNCENEKALYTWVVDGEVKGINYLLGRTFDYTFTTNGTHFIGLHLQNSALCDVEDVVFEVCVQNAPKPSFTLPGDGEICTSGTVKPTNTSVVDDICAKGINYKWIITGPKPVGFAGGTTATSKDPIFDFKSNGAYNVQLSITTPSCGETLSDVQEIAVNLVPVAKLSADAFVCGTNQTLTFGPSATVTKTTLTGSERTLPTTYQWTVTGGAYSFANGTTANSRYPQILFKDFATYTISVTHTNNCGTASDDQKLTFQEAPIVTSGGDQTVCEGDLVPLRGEITGSIVSFQWTGGAGTFSPSRNVKQPTYQPTAAELAAGTVTLTLEVTTSLPAPCNLITSPAVITLIRKDKITSAATDEVCTGQNFNYVIKSQNVGSTYTWTAAVTSGTATGFGATGSGNTINDVINDTGTGDAVVTYHITPATNGCPGIPLDLAVTINRIPNISAAAPPICSGQPAGVALTSSTANTLYTWTSTTTGPITGNTKQSTPASVTEIQDLLVNNGTALGTVHYTITPYHGDCQGAPIVVDVTVNPPTIQADAGKDETICAGPTYTLKGNAPAVGSGLWTLESGQPGITFSNNTDANAVVSGLQPGNTYVFRWTITSAPSCSPTLATVTIKTDLPTVAGTISGATSVCAGTNTGTLTLSGNVGDVIAWESSPDGTTWTTVTGATGTQLDYTDLTQTTQYRAVVQNGTCNIERSAPVSVNVNQPVQASNAGFDRTLCNETTTLLNGNSPLPYTGIWTQTAGPPVTFVDPTDPKTRVNGLAGNNVYKFVWTIKALAPCADSQDEVVITDQPDVIASYTADRTAGCGPLTVQFTNKSTPSVATTVYEWNFNDGSPVSNDINPVHTFQPNSDGTDAVYHVSLTVVSNCVVHPPVPLDILVRPAIPVAAIFPEKLSGCGSLAIKAENLSPGNNESYDFYLYDDKGKLIFHQPKPDKSPVQFDPLSPAVETTYTLYMVAKNSCGVTGESTHVNITISPANFVARAFAKDNKRRGCAPFSATFVNISSGGDVFTYEIYDDKGNRLPDILGGKVETPHTFENAGTYKVYIVASNDCGTKRSDEAITFEVYPQPAPNFDADVKTGCKSLVVNFSNLTPANGTTNASALSYDWDFGDGSPHFSGFKPLPHTYAASSTPYSVTLTVTNQATGCSDVVTKADLIKVNAPPIVDFTASPGFVTTIPNYHFAFDDQTSGNPVSWNWDFGDGQTSTGQNPGHTYADTGIYKVTLRVINREGCENTVTHNVQVTGTPGQLYMPNAFIPASATTELQTFMAKGSGIESWRMQIFNNYGQLVWETNKLSSRGEPVEGWDGTFKGVPVPQGVYIWQATAHFINGTDWKGMSYNNSLPKRTGVIHLIR